MEIFSGLLNNAVLMLVLCVFYDTFGVYTISKKNLRDCFTGVLVGLIGISVMLNPWSIQPGVFFDTRWVLISLCGLFFGLIPTAIAEIITGAFRLYQGGAGATVGTVVIVVTACVGLAWKYYKEKHDKPLGWKQLYVFGVLVQLAMLFCMFLMPSEMRIPIIKAVAPPILIIYPVLTMFVGLILNRQEARRNAEQELIQNRKDLTRERGLLKEVINSIPDLIFFKNTEGVYLGCNRSFELFVGLDEQRLLGKTDFDLFDPDTAEFVARQDNEVFTFEKSITNEKWVNYPNGRKVLLDTVKTPFKGLDGTLHGLVSISRDITERTLAEKKIVKSKREWEQTFDAMTDIITIQNKDMRIVRANKAAHVAFQVEPGELNGKYCYEVFRGTSEPCHNCPSLSTLDEYVSHGANIAHENLGKIFHVASSPVMDENGEFKHIVHIAKDITEQKKMEEDLFQSHKMEAIGTLAGGIAHDFNNILGVIIGFADMAKCDLPDGSQTQNDINRVLIAANRAKELVKQILTFSRKGHETQEPLLPTPIIKEALKLMRSSLPTTIEMREEIDPGCGSIIADPTNIHQVLVNLCTNALHAMEDEKGILTVSLNRVKLGENDVRLEAGVSAGTFVELIVSDTGCGMDKKTIERIFEPYFTTKDVGKGTGMGLALVHGIVQGCGGFISIDSEPNTGTTFHLYFPAIEEKTVGGKEEQQKILPRGDERILTVDDEEFVVEFYQATLEKLGYKVTAKCNSEKTFEAFQASPDSFDLVITDQTMPHLTGSEMAKQILNIRPNMPIILCTGYSSMISKEKAQEIGIKKFVMKPVSRVDLAMIVREVLDKSKS